jgi:hypothetical protein
MYAPNTVAMDDEAVNTLHNVQSSPQQIRVEIRAQQEGGSFFTWLCVYLPPQSS